MTDAVLCRSLLVSNIFFWIVVLVVQVVSPGYCRFMQSRMTCWVVQSGSPQKQMEEGTTRNLNYIVIIAVDVRYCGVLESVVRPNTSDFITQGLCQCCLIRSPYQLSLYSLIRPVSVSLTEAKAPAGIALWITETFKPPYHTKEWTVTRDYSTYY